MFGERSDNSGANPEFKPMSPGSHSPPPTRKKGGGSGPVVPPAAVAVAATLGGSSNATGMINAYRDAPNALRDSEDDELNNMEGGGAGAPGSVRVKSVAEIVAELDEDHDVRGPKGGCCARLFIPFLVALLLIVVFAATVWSSGTGEDEASSPRAAVFLIEGLTGPVFDALLKSGQHLPNIAALLGARGGVYAHCADPASATCARSVIVEDEGTGSVFVYSGSSIASILTGVPPSQHRVRNDTLDAYAEFAVTSKTYPSLAKRVKDAGKRVTVLGTSHLLNSFGATSGRCSLPGVLDMECANSKDTVTADVTEVLSPGTVSLECLDATTCNVNVRKIKTPTNNNEYSDGHAEVQFTRQLKEVFGGLEITKPKQESAVQNIVADNLDESLFIFHFDSLAVRAHSDALPDFDYSASSPSYVAQAYLIDSMIGQVLAFLHDRARTQKENWLVVGLADHGGEGKTFSPSTSENLSANQAIAFFMSTFTNNAKEYVKLRPLSTATSQLDVVPTVLRWLNIAPFDDETQAAVEGKNTSHSVTVDARLMARKVFDGQIKGICTSGQAPTDCE